MSLLIQDSWILLLLEQSVVINYFALNIWRKISFIKICSLEREKLRNPLKGSQGLVCVCVCVSTHVWMLSCVWLFMTPWTVVNQAPLSMGFSRQEYWSGLPFPPPRDLPNPGIKLMSPASVSYIIRQVFFLFVCLFSLLEPLGNLRDWHLVSIVDALTLNSDQQHCSSCLKKAYLTHIFSL